MIVVKDINEIKKIVSNAKKSGKSVGFVPTMGYLHEGHLSLIREARRNNDFVAVSIFVNPTQFSPNEDLDKYPRDLERDLYLCENEGVDLIFTPTNDIMYPKGYDTYVMVEKLANHLCGLSRPNHFRGVCTVVTKLFNIVKPDDAYFGQKDYQQFKIIERMTNDLNMDVKVHASPIVRESDGLAMSSRNKYLSKEERNSALILSKSLKEAEKLLKNGEKNAKKIVEKMRDMIENEPYSKIDYIEIVDEDSLETVHEIVDGKKYLIALAVFIGNTRLIDNMVWNA